jgi:hypothetical protein
MVINCLGQELSTCLHVLEICVDLSLIIGNLLLGKAMFSSWAGAADHSSYLVVLAGPDCGECEPSAWYGHQLQDQS